MGAVRLLRTLAPLALVASLAAACGNGSSSSSDSGDPSTGAATSSTVQLRLVTARYAQDTSKGQEQLGPQTPQDMVDTMKNYDCTSKPTVVEGKLIECDAARNVFLLDPPLVDGGIASAKAMAIGSGDQWYVRVTFDETAAATLSKTVDSSPGSELAVVLDGKVVTAVIVDSSMKDGHIGITGDFDKTSATQLADQLSA
jgi:preprotein translocase subunit SecD